jgi:hypothetical protein
MRVRAPVIASPVAGWRLLIAATAQAGDRHGLHLHRVFGVPGTDTGSNSSR